MRRSILRGGVLLGAALLLFAREAGATNVTEFPDNGSEQMGRGGAWVARASDPLAAFFNPAGLAGQPTRLVLQSNITFSHTCFTRVAATNDTTQDTLMDPTTRAFPRVCNDIQPGVNPQLGMTFRVTPRIGIGFLPLIAPSSVGMTQWPEFVNGSSPNQPAPNRYLLLQTNGVVVTPTLGVGAEVIDGLRLGASFQWGIAAKLHFENASAAQNTNNQQPSANDVKAELDAKQFFIPGFTLGAIWSPTDNLDVAGWYKWSAPIDAKGDVKTNANYFTNRVANGDTSRVTVGDTSQPDCGKPGNAPVCGSGDNASIKVPIPMEAKLGVRFHKPIAGHRTTHYRDPMSQDQWDVELDFTWANNSTFDSIQLRFPSDATGNGTIPVNGTPGNLPPVGDVPHKYKDVVGVRLGGDYNVVPGKIAVRAGTFYETNGQDPQFQNIDFSGSWKFGLALGGTYRLHLSPEKRNALEFSLGYGHVFYGTQNNNSPDADGIHGLSGTPCNPSPNPDGSCPNGGQRYRTIWPVNLGTITNATNVFNVGVGYKF